MSIASMADAQIQRRRHDSRGRGRARATAGIRAKREMTPLSEATDVARYVPTEAVGVYIAILAGAFSPLVPKAGQKASDLDYSSRWWFLLVMLAVTAAVVWLMY